MSKSYSQDQAAEIMEKMLEGSMPEEEMGTILQEMAERGETVDEITGMAKVMRSFVNPVQGHEDAVDTCGTGGSGLPRINTSTMAAFVLAAGEVKVAKHGNRAASGRCGSFDVLEALGAKIELPPEQVARSLSSLGIGLMFAPLYHPAMKNVMPVRKALGIRTVFNLLGPLTNPAFVKRQIIGVSDIDIAPKIIEVLKNLGHERAFVVHGLDGLDEITVTGPSMIFELNQGQMEEYDFDPLELGVEPVSFDEIEGGTAEQNAEVFREVLGGTVYGPMRSLVLVNSAAGFLLANRVGNLQEGYELAVDLIDEGRVQELLENYITFTQSL